MNTTSDITTAAATLGHKGGIAKTAAKIAAARANGRKGGRPGGLISSRRASSIPGDTARQLTAAATDSTGRVWPAGTIYQPQSGGVASGRRYQDVRIAGITVTFLE